MMQTKVHWCSDFNSFFVIHPETKHKNINKSWDKTVLQCGLRFLKKILIMLKCKYKKKFFFKVFKITFQKKTCFLCKLKAKLGFFLSETTFLKQFSLKAKQRVLPSKQRLHKYVFCRKLAVRNPAGTRLDCRQPGKTTS